MEKAPGKLSLQTVGGLNRTVCRLENTLSASRGRLRGYPLGVVFHRIPPRALTLVSIPERTLILNAIPPHDGPCNQY